MELGDYLKILRQYWVGVTVITLLGIGVALAWSVNQPRVYSSDASGILVTATDGDVTNKLVADNYAKSRIKTYLPAAESCEVAEFAAERLGITQNPCGLRSRIGVENPEDTAVLKITADGPSPAEARDLATAWVAGLVDYINRLENGESEPAAAASAVTLRSLDDASLPSSPSSPNTPRNTVLGGIAGVLLGLAYALARSRMDRRVRNAAVVEEHLGLPVIGLLPFTKNLAGAEARLSPGALPGADDHQFAEALRELRTNVRFMDVDNPPRVIVVTSALPGEGKSTVAANLAVAIALSGQQTVLVDGDLRRPTVANSFGVLPGVGITDVLVGRLDLADAIQPWGERTNLMILGAGSKPPNPSELLGSQAAEAIIHELAKHAVVIIDAPPLVLVTDAAILGARAGDGVLLVASAKRTTIDALQRGLANLERVNARALGVILNRVPRRGVDSAYYGYGARYGTGYYGESDGKKGKPAKADKSAKSSKGSKGGKDGAAAAPALTKQESEQAAVETMRRRAGKIAARGATHRGEPADAGRE